MNLNYEKIAVKYDGETAENVSRVVIEPLEKGYSRIMAVPLRNVLLSSMPGAAVVGVKIDGIRTEMTTIDGSINDMIDLILNLKEIKFKTENEGIQVLKFKQSKEGYYTSDDIELVDGVELATPGRELIALNGKKEVEIDIYIKKGRGYVESTNHKELNSNEEYKDVVKIDGMFKPIKRVKYKVEDIRVGQSEDFERLVLELETDGSMPALEAVTLAAKIVSFHFSFFEDMKEMADEYELNKQEEIQEENRILEKSISMLDLSVRSFNCLKKAEVETIKDLCNLTFMDLKSIEHLGKKSLEEILMKIDSLGLSLKVD